MKILKRIIIFVVCIAAAVCAVVFVLNVYIKNSVKNNIISSEEATQKDGMDCIIVLGAGVRDDGTPSHMLEDRLLTAVELYNSGAAPKIIMSGDHGSKDYDEVNVMKEFAISHGVPSEDIFMDHAGFSTYESMYRARDIFEVRNAVIVTQEYHLYRALYVAEKLGIEAYGVSADLRSYRAQSYREAREAIARVKDFFYTIFKPEPTYLGDTIPVSGSGDITNDK